MEQVAIGVMIAFVAIIGILVGGVALVERSQRRKVEALGRRRKDRIQL